MKNYTLKLTKILTILILTATILSCGGSANIDTVKNGFLDAFGDEVSVGEAFDVVSNNSTNWNEQELDDARWSSDDYKLVEASWEGTAGEVIIQFIVEKDGNSFELHGASVDGEFMEAMTVIYGIIAAYEES